MKNIAIVSSMQVRIMPFTISILFELFWLWYDMNTWQFNLFLLQQVIKDPITLSDVESVVNLILLTFRSRFQARAYEWTPQLHSAMHRSASSSSNDSLLYYTMLM
jgi:hypothetical protein